MFRKFLISLLLSVFLLTGCCEFFVAGTGTGIGVYTYRSGELKRLYQATFDKTIQAGTATLKKLKITITEKTSDGIETTIKARRTDKTPVTVKVVMIAPRITEVSIRTGRVGIWDKKVSELIHASIAQRLQ